MHRYVTIFLASALSVVLGCNKQPERQTQGVENGQCYPNKTCNSDLACNSSNVCVRSSGSGGSNGHGGSEGSGGDEGSGGSEGSGGTTGSGGSQGSGGTTSAGTNACSASAPSDGVVFCNGQAVGTMSGWGWVALGSADTITDPTCDTAKAPITAAATCKTATNWSKGDALCMTGKVPALPAKPADSDYTSNWGIQLGVNAKDPNAGMGSSYKTITLSLSGSPTAGLRAVVHRAGDPDSTSFCAPLTPDKAITLTTFNNKCWDSSGDDLTDSDVAKIDQVGVQVTSGESEITVTDLCLTKIAFGN